MLADHRSVRQDKIAAIDLLFQAFHSPTQKASIVVVGNKADFVAFRFFGEFGIAHITSHLAIMWFVKLSNGKHRPSPVFLLQAPQNIRLVFVFVNAFRYDVPSIFKTLLGIMSRSNVLTIKCICSAEQCRPFDMRIAHDARIRRSSCQNIRPQNCQSPNRQTRLGCR